MISEYICDYGAAGNHLAAYDTQVRGLIIHDSSSQSLPHLRPVPKMSDYKMTRLLGQIRLVHQELWIISDIGGLF